MSAGATISIPGTHAHSQISDDGLTQANAVTLPAGNSGQLLLVSNLDADFTSGDAAIPPGYTVQFVYGSSEWIQTSISDFPGGHVRAVKSLTAAADLNIGNYTLTAAQLQATASVQFHDLVSSTDIAEDAIEASELADDSVASANIIANTIVADDIAEDAIEASELADDSVASANIIDLTIVAGDVALNTLTAAQIGADAIEASELADNSVASANIVDGTISGSDVSSSAALSVGSVTSTGDVVSSSGYVVTLASAAASPPATCSLGAVMIATASDSICFCVGSNTWKCVAGTTWS